MGPVGPIGPTTDRRVEVSYANATASGEVPPEEQAAVRAQAGQAEPRVAAVPGGPAPARDREGDAPEQPAQRLRVPGERACHQDGRQEGDRGDVPRPGRARDDPDPAREEAAVPVQDGPDAGLEE